MSFVDFSLDLRRQRALATAFAFFDIFLATFFLGFLLVFAHGRRRCTVVVLLHENAQAVSPVRASERWSGGNEYCHPDNTKHDNHSRCFLQQKREIAKWVHAEILTFLSDTPSYSATHFKTGKRPPPTNRSLKQIGKNTESYKFGSEKQYV